MSAKSVWLALGLAIVLAAGLCAGEPAPEAPKPEAPVAEAPIPETPDDYGLFDRFKNIEAGGAIFNVTGEARFRYQYWSDFDIDEYRPVDGRGGRTDGFFESRVKLGVEAKIGEQVTLFVEGIDARRTSYDDGPFMRFGTVYPARRYDPGEDRLDLHQAWALIQTPGGLPVAFKVGRQEIVLGSGRLLGSQGWRNDPQLFDAVVMLVPTEIATIAVWGGKAILYPKRSSPNHVLNQFEYYGLYSMWKMPGIDAFDTYIMHLRDDHNNVLGEDLEITAVGIRLQDTAAEAIHYGFEIVGEFGEVGPLTLQAWALHTELGYTFAGLPWAPTVTAEYNRASGDDRGLLGDSRLNTFFTWFPNYHGMFGIMDMFQWSNIEHYKLGCTMQPHERVTIEVAGHIFSLDHSADSWFTGRTYVPAPLGGSATAGRAGTAANSNHVGEEIDVVVTVDVSENCTIEGGYAHFFAGSYIDETGPTGGADFAYVMTTFRF